MIIWVTAEAMGGTGETFVRSAADIECLPAPDSESLGRIPKMLEAMHQLRKRLGPKRFYRSCLAEAFNRRALSAMNPVASSWL